MKKKSTLLKGLSCCAIAFFGSLTSSQAQTITLTHSNSQTITAGNSVSCNDGSYTRANHYYRVFKISDFVSTSSFTVDSVTFGVDGMGSIIGSQTVTINLYSLSGTALTLSNLTLLGNVTGDIADMGQGTIRATIPATIPGSGTLVVEVASEDGEVEGSAFLIGSNSLGQTGPSYIYAPACTINAITDLASISSPTATMLVMNVYGTAAPIATPGAFVNPVNPVCSRSTVTYTVPAVTGVTYNWAYSGTGVTIDNTTSNHAVLHFSEGATSGDLSVTATAGTTTTAPRTLPLTVNAGPVPAISRGGNVLTTGSFATYAWYRNNIAITGATSNSYTLTQNGSYFVKVTGSANTCSGNSDTVVIDDITPLGIHETDRQSAIKIYPNPAKEILHIDSPEPVNATIQGVDGKVLTQVNNAKNIDLRLFANGIYFVTITDKEGGFIKKEKFVKSN